MYICLLYSELYTTIRYLSLDDKPNVPVGQYREEDVKAAITHHWVWMSDTFKVVIVERALDPSELFNGLRPCIAN